MPIAEADTRTLGRAFIFASAFKSARVVSIRLARSSSFLCFDQRPSAIDAPARFTTASAPTPAPPNSPVPGFQATANPSVAPSLAALCGRTNRQTVCPARASALPSAVPASPDEPATRIFIFSSALLLLLARTIVCVSQATQAALDGQAIETFKLCLVHDNVESSVGLNRESVAGLRDGTG